MPALSNKRGSCLSFGLSFPLSPFRSLSRARACAHVLLSCTHACTRAHTRTLVHTCIPAHVLVHSLRTFSLSPSNCLSLSLTHDWRVGVVQVGFLDILPLCSSGTPPPPPPPLSCTRYISESTDMMMSPSLVTS